LCATWCSSVRHRASRLITHLQPAFHLMMWVASHMYALRCHRHNADAILSIKYRFFCTTISRRKNKQTRCPPKLATFLSKTEGRDRPRCFFRGTRLLQDVQDVPIWKMLGAYAWVGAHMRHMARAISAMYQVHRRSLLWRSRAVRSVREAIQTLQNVTPSVTGSDSSKAAKTSRFLNMLLSSTTGLGCLPG
jgi:hypothetical protein